MELDAYTIIKGPVITEKVTTHTERGNVYGLRVDPKANKVQIRQAVERIWGVKVLKVSTMIRKGKPSRSRFQRSHKPATKIALVKLAEGQSIES